MDYFTLLNLAREPFANSPDPDMFYGTPLHRRCLQDLEISIWLRRGLNVVIGEIGTGKSTLCRQLIRRLDRGQGRQVVRLLLEPEFASPREFLAWVADSFGLAASQESSERQLKERFKNYLFEQGAAQDRIVTLIIDEGQKLPGFCLEILREFLNYETNQHKLLQIVIFAQEEFSAILREKANFADRISVFTHLQPLSREETRDLIRHRLRLAHRDPEKAPELFTWPAYWLIHRVTGGYPRKIVMLCSQILLALIIKDRTMVNGALVYGCARRMFKASLGRKPLLAWAGSTAGVLAAGLLAWQLVSPPAPPPLPPSMKIDQAQAAAPAPDPAAAAPLSFSASPESPSPPPSAQPLPQRPAVAASNPKTSAPHRPKPEAPRARESREARPSKTPAPGPPGQSASGATGKPLPPMDEKTLFADRIAATGTWLSGVERSRFSIQLAQVDLDPTPLEQLVHQAYRLQAVDRVYVYQEPGKNPPRWKLLYGDYPTVGLANQAIAGLPAPLRAYRPFVRNVSHIMDEADRKGS